MYFRAILILLFFTFGFASMYALQADFAIDKLYEFELNETDDDSYELQCWTTLDYIFQTERSFDYRTFYFFEAADNPITRQKAKFEDKDLTARIDWSSVYSSDVFYSDDKRNRVTIPAKLNPEIGDVLEIQYKTEYSDYAHLPIVPLHGDSDVNRIQIDVLVPKSCTIDFQFFSNRPNIEPIIQSEGNSATFKIENIKAIEAEDYDPFPGMLGYVMISIYRDGESILPNTPEKFTKWYLSRMTRSAPTREELLYLTPEIPDSLIGKVEAPDQSKELLNAFSRNRVTALLNKADSLSTDEDRVNLFLDFISRNVRYVAEHQDGFSFYPHPPVKTLNNMYGDCKDKSLLLRYLTSMYGINIDLALVSVDPAPPFDGIHPFQYDHMICHWENNGKTYFLDPTSIGCSTYLRSEILDGKKALILSEINPREQLIEGALSGPAYEIFITAKADSLNKARAEIVLHGRLMLMVLNAADHLNDLDLENYLANELSDRFVNLKFDFFDLKHTDSTQVILDATARLSEMVPVSSKRLYLPKTPFAIDSQSILKREGDAPINSSYPLHGRLVIDIQSPGYIAGSDSLSITDSMWDFNAECHSANGSIHAAYELYLAPGIFQGDDNLKLVQCIREYDKNRKSMFAINKEMK